MMRAGLIGTGMVAATYAAAIAASTKVRLSRVAARTQASADGFVAAHPGLGAEACAGALELVTDPEVDFVILATPPDAREAAVHGAILAAKPVLMEKPVERDLPRARALVEACEAAGVPLGIVLQHRARPVVADLTERMAQLGQLHAVEVAVPWWRPQAYYDAPGRGTYAQDGGGVLITQAIHTLDLMLSLTGPVTEVTAMAATTGFHQMEAEDFVSAGLRFASGAVGTLFASTASYPGRGETITLHGAQGSATLEAGQVRISWQDGRDEVLGAAAASGAGADPMAFTSDWHQWVIEDFAQAVAEGRAPMVPGREALAVHGLIGALERSAREGRRVEVG